MINKTRGDIFEIISVTKNEIRVHVGDGFGDQ
jgi:hypothetical protein